MADAGEEKTMRGPSWKFEWNLNTLVIVFGFIAGIAAWGATWERVNSGQRVNANAIDRLDKRLTAVETSSRLLDNHELRIANMEQAATDASASMKSLDATINGLSSDMRVVKEILLRLEASQRGRSPP